MIDLESTLRVIFFELELIIPSSNSIFKNCILGSPTLPVSLLVHPSLTFNLNLRILFSSKRCLNFRYSSPKILNLYWSLKSSKENKIKQLKEKGYQLLLPTDWYIIREVAEKKSIPDKIKEQRKAIYDSINKKEAEINSLNTIKKVEEFDITI